MGFDDVSFKYFEGAEKDALSHINLHIAAGQTVGVIGGTGSAKSTLVQLIPRLYDATAGTVRVGGVDVRQYDLAALRDAVGIVLQKNVLFSGTVRENLQWGDAMRMMKRFGRPAAWPVPTSFYAVCRMGWIHR